jgi:serine/threonine protein phosphatase PrpC
LKVRTSTYGLPRNAGEPSADAFAVKAWDETVIAVLSDGAGTGAPAREAAQRAAAGLVDHYRARPRTWTPERALLEFTRLMNRTFYQESQARYERSEMVATLAVAIIEGDRLFGINAGDSRVYHWHQGELNQLSLDQVDTIQTNMLTQALGLTQQVEPHFFSAKLADGDLIFLCSDGVSNQLTADEIATSLQQQSTAQNIVTAARAVAKQESMDDMSAIVLNVRQIGKLRAMTERHLTIPKELHKGDIVDGYELMRSFQGTQRVWLADKDGHRVVIKFAPVEALESELHLDAFTRETWNATRVHSEHFVRGTEPAGQTMRYYLMEFMDAPNLAVVLHERVLSVDSAVGLGRFLAEACQTLLRLDLAHGDIKPENILCIGDYAKLTFKLVDLGSSAELFSVSSRAGTASYLAPERFRASPVCEATEIFAIGVTLYQSLTGVLPYGEIERFQTPTFQTAQPITKRNPNVPPWLEAVIARAITISPEKRYQHFSEVMFDLDHPHQVEPFFANHAPLLERNPLAFYKAGFFILLILSIALGLLLLKP